MNRLIFLFLIVLSTSLYGGQGLLILPIESEEVSPASLNYYEVELNKQFSTLFDLEVVRDNPDEGELSEFLKEAGCRYYLKSSLDIVKEAYVFSYSFFDILKNEYVYRGQVSETTLEEVFTSLNTVLLNIRSALRKPPESKKTAYSFIVIETDIPEADVFINGKAAGLAPVSTRQKQGDIITLEARTESYQKKITYKVDEHELNEVLLELEPITGSFLLKGDVLGRTLYINDEPFEITDSALFKDIPVGFVTLVLEGDWGTWEETIFVEEGKLTIVEVEYEVLSRVEVEVPEEALITVTDSEDEVLFQLEESETLTLEPGEYIFITSKKDHISQRESLVLDSQVLHEYRAPELIPVVKEEKEPVAVILPVEEVKSRGPLWVKESAFWSAIASGVLLAGGAAGEYYYYSQYHNADITSEALYFRDRGESLREINISLLSAGVASLTVYFLSGYFYD